MAARETLRLGVISPRFPWPPFRGDRVRALVWLEALRELGQVTLIAPAGSVPDEWSDIEHVPVRVTGRALARGAVQAVAQRLPLQSLMTLRFDWAEHLRRDFDAAVVLLSRLHPAIRSSLRARFTVLDAVDSLAHSAVERRAAGTGIAPLLWAAEQRLMARLERQAAGHYDAVLVSSEHEAAFFGGRAVAVPNGVTVLPLAETPREFDFAFWGRLAYFANRHAVEVLLGDIWPFIRRQSPGATLLIGGADAPSSIRARSGRDGVTVMSPVADRGATLRRAAIALFPMTYGTGHSNKVLEAAEAGCAVIATPKAVRGLPHFAGSAVVAELSDIAATASRLHGAPGEVVARGRAARSVVEMHYSRADVCRRLGDIILGGVGA